MRRALCYAVYRGERYMYRHDIDIQLGAFVKLYKFIDEEARSDSIGCGTTSDLWTEGSSVSWSEYFLHDMTSDE